MNTTIQRLVLGLGFGALALAGCDGGEKAKPDAKAKTAKAGADKGGDAKKDGAAKKGGPAEDGAAKDGEAKDGEAKDGEAKDPAGGKAAAEPSEADVLAALDKRVTRAAKLAREIEKKPENADDILEAADLDRAGFEDLIYTIGADPQLSKQYQLAMAGD